MPKYRVSFKTEVQTDGWTDPRDLEYETLRETVTVEAKNKATAIIEATLKAYGYPIPARVGYGTFSKWNKGLVSKVAKIVKKKTG